MAFIQVPNELLDADISPAEFRLIVQLINASYGTDKPNGVCYWGYKNLAEQFKTNKSAVIKQVNHLIELGFLERSERDPKYRAQPLRLTLNRGMCRNRRPVGGLYDDSDNSSEGCLKDTPKGCLKDTPKGCLKDTEGCLKDTVGCLKDTPHIDLKFKYQDLNTKKNACAREDGCLKYTLSEAKTINQIAPADVAAGRSMPIQESAKEVRAEAPAANIDLRALWTECCRNFKQLTDDLELVQAGFGVGLREKSKFSVMARVRALEAVEWLQKRGINTRILEWNEHFCNEQIIKEVV